jgi:nucleoid-associated protein YgaU
MRRSIIFITAVAVLAFAAAALPAQSLLDNEHYQKAQALKAQSDAALAAGDYDAATALAEEAKAELAKSDAYVEDMLWRYRANGRLQQAAERLSAAKDAGANEYAKESYDDASSDIDRAWASYNGSRYEDSIDFAKRAIATLDAIPPKPVAVVEPVVEPVVTPVVEPVVEPVVAPTAPPLPAAYTVRLRLPLRDCLWRIAAYPFVYNDPWEWKTLWEANRNVLTDPNNPDLIEIGQVLTIPGIAGETRQGTYDPALDYPTFSK